ncbi:hypothetical protein [Geothrix oryzisoli]|uniref:hypothetical protein n=1 Tax=Geothrix oryzisoli TaxID=2922721 RepID=UPI001FAE6AF1|nr:hypothetical protein [Geothrix oryzisoli]
MPMPLDVRTLCFASGAAVLSLALVMTYVWRQRRTYAGFGQWTLSAWSACLGTILLGERGHLPDVLSIVIANLALYLATTLVLTGLVTFTGARVRAARYAALVGLVMALIVVFAYVHPSLRFRQIVFSFTAGGLCLRAAQIARRRLPVVLADANVLVTATLFVMGTVYVLRGVASLAAPPPHEDFLAPSMSQVVALLLFLTGEACVYGGLMVVNAQRVERDLQNSVEECQVLRGILPICATCKKIRDDRGAWNQMESYIRQHSAVEFTHGICPDCAKAFKEKAPARA